MFITKLLKEKFKTAFNKPAEEVIPPISEPELPIVIERPMVDEHVEITITKPKVTERKNILTLDELKDNIHAWLNVHRDKFNTIQETVPDKLYDYQIHLIPNEEDALTITFTFGGQVKFFIKISDYILPFDDSYQIRDIEYTLDAYVNGSYYVLEKRLYNKKIASEIVIKGRNGNEIRSLFGNIDEKSLELITERKLLFPSLLN